MDVFANMTVTSVCGVSVVPSLKGRFDRMEGRKMYGLSFCFDEGKITYISNGKSYVSDRNSAIILPKGGHYQIIGEETGVFPLINFYADGLDLDSHMLIRLHNSDSYVSDFERMRSIWNRGGSKAELLSVFYSIIARLCREELPYHRALKRSMDYLSKNIYSPSLTVEELAKQGNVSEVYFRKIFKEVYGCSPKQYIIDLRIRQAKLLLLENSMSVTYIAEACGFASVYHFSRAFKSVTGLTPVEFSDMT